MLLDLVSDINFDDFRIGADLLHRSFREDFSEVHHGDAVGDFADEFHIVFNDDDGPVFGNTADQFGGLRAFADAHAGDRFVEHDDFRFLHQEHANFEPLFLAVAENACFGVEFIEQSDLGGDVVALFEYRFGAAEKQAADDAATGRVGELEIFEDREVFVDRGVLEFSADACADDFEFLHSAEFLALEFDRAGGGECFTADQIQYSGFTCAVWSDDDVDVIFSEVEIESVDCFESVE